MHRRNWLILTALLLLPVAGCEATLSKADEGRIQALEASEKSNSDKIAEQGKSIQALTEQVSAARLLPTPTPAPASTPAATPTSKATATPAVSFSPIIRYVPVVKATNGSIEMWATKVSEYYSIDDLGKMIPMTAKDKEALAGILAALKTDALKIIVISANMTNLSSGQLSMGCSYHGGPLLLRGTDGTQVLSSEQKSVFLSTHIEGGFPFDSLIPPQGTIDGKLCYIVKQSFDPSALFPENDAHLGPHPDSVAVKLK
jgi:hypothetical protein